MGFTDECLTPLVDEGLGDSTHLVDLGDGRAPAMDTSRDLRVLAVLAGGPVEYTAAHGAHLVEGTVGTRA